MTSAPGAPAGFLAAPHASLARGGVAGARPEAFGGEDGLLLRDEAGGALDVPLSRIARLRLGTIRTRQDTYPVARVFLAGEAEPLVLMPREPRCPHYAGAMRRLAQAVAEAHGLERIERGLDGRTALVGVIAVAGVAGAASVMALLVWRHPFGTFGAAVFAALMGGLVALFAWQASAREAPRPVRSLAEIDRYLPDAP